METITYQTMDKSDWGDGAWQDEPDKKQWKDKETGLPCLIVRNRFGGLCGYVGVERRHPFFEKNSADIDFDVHGGLTFSGPCSEGDEKNSICHIPGEGESDHVWWFGFDCAHGSDLLPAMVSREREMMQHLSFQPLPPPYRDLAYVTAECEFLAQKLKALVDLPDG